MVAVFVGEDNAGDLFEVAADEGEALGDLAAAEPGIDEQFRRVGFNQGAIARATAPQNRDTHPHVGDFTRSGDGRKISAEGTGGLGRLTDFH